MVVFAGFVLLMALTVLNRERLGRILRKPGQDWVLDGTNLLVQGIGIPALQVTAILLLCRALMPDAGGTVRLPGWLAFAVNFVAVDYVYYWNHRLLHGRVLWPVHLVHHTVTDMDVLGTSRNTLWSSLLFVYLWANGLALYLLADPTWFAAGAAATACLDLWRHSSLHLPRGSLADRLVSAVLITPLDHAWHHAQDARLGNYGANWKLWDRLHGTLVRAEAPPEALGVRTGLSLPRRLLWPFGRAEEA